MGLTVEAPALQLETERSLTGAYQVRTRHPPTDKSKGERTREQVIVQAAALFNQLGYANASMSDIMHATGLKKGGIYRHFENKQALALAAFDYSVEELGKRFRQALEGKTHAVDRLQAVIGVYARIPVDPPVPGGCPVLNAAIESDDSDPVIKARVSQVMRDWHAYLRKLVREGQQCQELRESVDADQVATLLIASLEGAIMLSKLQGSPAPMTRVAGYLLGLVRDLARA